MNMKSRPLFLILLSAGLLWSSSLVALAEDLPTSPTQSTWTDAEVEALAAWASLLDGDARARVIGAAPESLRRSIEAVSVFPNRAQQVLLADRGRQALARGFQAQLARARRPFAAVLAGETA